MTNTAPLEKTAAPLSRLGRRPVEIPSGVKVSVTGSKIAVEGARGKLSWDLPSELGAVVEGSLIKISPKVADVKLKALHGMSRKIISNLVEGVTKGFSKTLVIEGVGFRSVIAGNKITMTLGFSHPAVYTIAAGISVKSDPKTPNILVIEGNDKQMVGETAAQIRAIKPPEPYKGTGIRYSNEIIKRKAGKAAVTASGGGKKP